MIKDLSLTHEGSFQGSDNSWEEAILEYGGAFVSFCPMGQEVTENGWCVSGPGYVNCFPEAA